MHVCVVYVWCMVCIIVLCGMWCMGYGMWCMVSGVYVLCVSIMCLFVFL